MRGPDASRDVPRLGGVEFRVEALAHHRGGTPLLGAVVETPRWNRAMVGALAALCALATMGVGALPTTDRAVGAATVTSGGGVDAVFTGASCARLSAGLGIRVELVGRPAFDVTATAVEARDSACVVHAAMTAGQAHGSDARGTAIVHLGTRSLFRRWMGW